MKKTLTLLLCVLLVASAALPSFAKDENAPVTIDASWSVLVGESADEYELFAAEKLSGMLSDVFGEDVRIVTSPTGKNISVARVPAESSGLADNGYRIKAGGGGINITGTGVSGVQRGAYRFLEEFCGYRVYTSALTALVHAQSLSVPADTDITYSPAFEYTETDWLSPLDAEYSMANGLNGGMYRDLGSETGGTVDYLGGFCHTFYSLCESGTQGRAHPEQLALHGGERTDAQPCLSNPEVFATALRNVLRILEREHDPDAPLQIVSVSQNDNESFCECADCVAFEKAHGGAHSAPILDFVNRIADEVKAAGYDNVAIDTFAYQYSRQAPEGIVPRGNVIVRLCSIECCFTHPFDNALCSKNRAFMKDLKAWSRICDRLYVWDYAANYWHTFGIFPDFGVIQRDIQIFAENGVKGVYTEGNYYMRYCDTEFGELRAFLISKCLQDPYCDYGGLMDEFCGAYYGEGGRYIVRFIDTVTRFTKLNHVSVGTGISWSMFMDPATAAYCDTLWERAKACATEEQLERIKRSEISWRYWKADAGMLEFAGIFHGRNARIRLHDDIIATGATKAAESAGLTFAEDYMYIPVRYWFGVSLNAFDDFLLKVRRFIIRIAPDFLKE